MKTISPNFKSIIGRMIILLSFFVMIFSIIHYGILTNDAKNGIAFLYLLTVLLVYLSTTILLSFFGIIKVEINEPLEQVRLIRLFSKKIILTSEIAGYYKSIYHTRRGTSYGRIIKTKDNKIRELNPGNLNDIIMIDEILENSPIEFLGEKRSFYPFTSGL